MKEKLNNALNDIDQRFIEEAARADRFSGHASKILGIILIPAAAAVVALCLFALKKPQPGGVDLIQPSISSAADTLTLEDGAATAEVTTDSDSADLTYYSGIFSCDKHEHTKVSSDGNVQAKKSGTVVFTGELPNYGGTLIVHESDGSDRMYCHLSGFALEPDDTVQEGETVGRAGCPDGSEQPVEAVMLADNEIQRAILELNNSQNEEISEILDSSGVNESYDPDEAEQIISSGLLPLYTETLQDRNAMFSEQSGLDLYSEEMTAGTPVEVHSFHDGTVIAAKTGWNSGLGSYVVIDHGSGVATVYAHLGEIKVSDGETVKRSDVIAMTGSTGYVGYQHDLLHFEIRENGGTYVDSSTQEAYIEHDPEEENRIIAEICRRGSEYDQIGAQLLIRDSVMPLDKENMFVTTENGYDEWKGGMHYGVDLSGMNGSSQVYSYQSGVVLEAAGDGWNYGMGSYIVIDHGSGLVTVYAHLSRVDVTEGQQVGRGEVIGESGSTGYSTGVHLHFEIRENGIISTAMGNVTGHTHDHRWVSEGTSVNSTVDGLVWFVGEVPDLGKIVVLSSDNGRLTMYSHCSQTVVLPGDEVAVGERVAIAGNPDGSELTVIAEEEIDSILLSYYASQATDGQLLQSETRFIWPVGGEDGGVIREPMYGYGGYYGHNGIDIAALAGTEVFAAGSGRVVKAEWYEGYGKCVMIDHGDGLVTLYGHLGEINAVQGQEVTVGDVIGGVGHTGQTTTCILHFEVRLNDEQVDPTPYLPWHKVVDISG